MGRISLFNFVGRLSQVLGPHCWRACWIQRSSIFLYAIHRWPSNAWYPLSINRNLSEFPFLPFSAFMCPVMSLEWLIVLFCFLSHLLKPHCQRQLIVLNQVWFFEFFFSFDFDFSSTGDLVKWRLNWMMRCLFNNFPLYRGDWNAIGGRGGLSL